MSSEQDAPMNARPGEAGLEALWEHALDNWSNDASHTALLEAASAGQSLAFAAKRYRAELQSEDPAHKKKAEEVLEKITVLAFSQIESSKSPPPPSKRVITIIAVVVSTLLMWGCIYAMMD